MNRIKAFGAFWYDFVIGDDWHVAALVVAGLALTAAGVHAAHVNAWWLLPLLVFAALAWSLHRATARKPLSRTARRVSTPPPLSAPATCAPTSPLPSPTEQVSQAEQGRARDAPRLAADLGIGVRLPVGAEQVARELHRVVRRAARRRPGPCAGIAAEGGTEPRPERRREIRLRVRHAVAALAHQRRRLHPDPLAVKPRGRFGARHERGDQPSLPRRELVPSAGACRAALARRELIASGCH